METLQEFFWDFSHAAALWDKLIGHWIEDKAFSQQTQDFFSPCFGRRVVIIPVDRRVVLSGRFYEDWKEEERIWKRMWHILAMIRQIHP